MTLFARWLRRSLATTVAWLLAIGASAQVAPTPPLPFEDAGACPLEGCVYREWNANAPVRLLAERRNDAPVVFALSPGERATAVTGVVVTTRAGRVRFEESQRIPSSSGAIDIRQGEVLYLLTSQGEGYTKAWFAGLVYENVDSSSFMGSVCEDTPHLCSGRVVDKPRFEWWVQMRNAAGQVGWTRDTDRFDGKSALDADVATDAATIDRLIDLVRQRLEVAPIVARAKWNSKAPIEDVLREQQVITEAVDRAGVMGIDRRLAESFFRGQIEASKVVQRALHADWAAHQQPPFAVVADLNADVRPVLDRLTPEMVQALSAAAPTLDHPETRALVESRAATLARTLQAEAGNMNGAEAVRVATAPLLTAGP